MTPKLLAQELCAELLLADNAPRVAENWELRDLFFRLVRERRTEGFFALPHTQDRKAAELMLSAVQELERYSAPRVGGNDRLDALQALREEYAAEKKRNNLLDGNDLLRLALAQDADAAFARSRFTVLSSAAFPGLAGQLVDRVAEGRLEVVPVEMPEGAVLPADCIGGMGEPVAVPADRLRFVRCRGEETEEWFVLRDILEGEVQAEDCAVVCLSGGEMPGLVSAAEEWNISVTSEGGLPLSMSRTAMLLHFLSTWTAHEYDAEELRSLMLSGAVSVVHSNHFADRLRARNIGWGKDRLKGRFLEKEEGDDPETLWEWKKFLHALMLAAEQERSIYRQKEALRVILRDYGNRRNKAESLAVSAMLTLIERINYLADGETALSRLLQLTEQTAAGVGQEQAGALWVVPMAHAFCTGRKKLYICGLSRFALQGGAESPILLDEERERYGLPTAVEQERENNFRLRLLLSQHEGEVVLSYNDYDMDHMTALQPAPVYRELLNGGTAEKISLVPETPGSLGEYVAQGKLLELELEPGGCSIDSTPVELRPERSYSELLNDRVFSPSALEEALGCPMKFYLNHIVKLRPDELPVRSYDSWLAANEMGTLCHRVLERYYSEPGSDPEKLLSGEIELLKKTRPEGPETAVRRDTENARRMIRRAISWTGEEGRIVRSTEQDFGKNGNEPVTLTLGERTIRLCGSIDRIDELTDGRVAVLDYKTGRPKHYSEHLDEKLQPCLYALAAEQLQPGLKVTDSGYLFLRDSADYLEVSQSAEERKRKLKTVSDLLEFLQDEGRAQTAAPAFEIAEDGSIAGVGTAEERTKALTDCSRYCSYCSVCGAAKQIAQQRLTEEAEGGEDDE